MVTTKRNNDLSEAHGNAWQTSEFTCNPLPLHQSGSAVLGTVNNTPLTSKEVMDKMKYTLQSGSPGIYFFFMKNLQKFGKSQPKPDADDYIMKLVDDILTFVTMATKRIEGESFARTIKEAFRIFLKCRYNESTYKILFKRFIPYFGKIISEFSVQSMEHIETARDFLTSYKDICNSEIALKIYRCSMYALSLSLFDKLGVSFDDFGYTKLEQVAIKKKFYKRTDFLYVLLDTSLFIVEKGYQIYLTGDVSCIFHSGGQYKKIYDECRSLQRKSHLLHNPEEHGFTESAFRADLDNVIEKLENIRKHSFRLEKSDKDIVKLTLDDMLMMRDDLNTRSAARRNRKAPFSLEIFGDSGIGKTTITNILCTYFAKHQGLPLGDEYRYTVNPSSKYWDGFVSSCHTIILDDVANEAPDMKDPKSLNEVIQIINNASYCPDQAALESKGKTPLRAKFVIGTTNVKDLNAYHYFSCPSAVQRRFPYIITPTVKEIYKDERGMLNSSCVPDLGPYPDLWHFKVELVKPVPLTEGRSLATLEILHESINLRKLLVWLDSAITKFNVDQTRVKSCLDAMQKVELCICCNLPDTMCEAEVQSLEIPNCFMYTWMLIIAYIQGSYIFGLMVIWFEYYILRRYTKFVFNNKLNDFKRKYINAEYWMNLGNKMQERIGHPKVLIAITVCITASLTFYKIYNSTSKQGEESEKIGSRPDAEENGRENVWYNNALDLSSANFTRESSSSKNLDFNQFCKKIGNNVVSMSIDRTDKNTSITGKALCLGGHIYLTNNHNVPDLSVPTKISVIQTNGHGLNSNTHFTLSESDVHRIPNKDLAFLLLRDIPPKKKIVQYIQIGNSNGIFNGNYLRRTPEGELELIPITQIKQSGVRNLKFESRNLDAKVSMVSGRVGPVKTINGDCGMPLVVNSSFGYSIVGLHCLAGNFSNDIYATQIDGEFLSEIYGALWNFNVESGDFHSVSSQSAVREVTDLHKKSVVRFIPEGNLLTYGSFSDFRGKSKSMVENTPMSNFLLEEGYQIKYGKPEMKSWMPWHIALKDIVQPVNTLSTCTLNKCVQGYINDVMMSINQNDIKDMMIILDDFTAINGAQVAYIDKMNRNTSAGNPWKKSKKFFMKSIPPAHGMLDPIDFSDEIKDRLDDIVGCYQQGKQFHPNFCAHLKDEAVTFQKAKIGKTRVFTGAPLDWCIIVRKYLLSFTRLVQNNRLSFEAAPGTIAQSLEWHELYDYITIHGGDRIIAGDYKSFDKKMSPKEILAAFDVIIHFCKISGNYTPDDLHIIQCIAEDTAFALVDYNGDLVQFFGSNPSGNPLTVILNSIVNSLRMRYVYHELNANKEVRTFKENVSLMTYGDDNIGSVSKNCDWFNHTAISSCFDGLGIVYTMPDKEANSIPFVTIDDSSFLKRVWRRDDELNCFVAPLAHESIERMLMVWTRSKTVTPECQGIDIISTALREYFWYGRDTFESKRTMLMNLVSKLEWNDWVGESTFPSFEDLSVDFKNNSRKCAIFDTIYPEEAI